MGVPSQHRAEEGGAGGQDHLVRLDLLILTGQGHVKEVFVLPQLTEGCGNVRLKIIPPETEFFCSHFLTVFCLLFSLLLLCKSVIFFQLPWAMHSDALAGDALGALTCDALGAPACSAQG